MTLTQIGDGSQFLLTRRHNVALRDRLYRLTSELNTGQKADLTAAIGRDTGRLADLDRQIALSAAHGQTSAQTREMFAVIQTSLSRVADLRGTLAGQFAGIAQTASTRTLGEASAAGTEAFSDMVQALNLTFGGRSLLAGRATDTAPLAAAETMMASIKAAALGVTTGSDLAVAVDGWFDTPGAGFDTLGYQGDTGGRIALQISETESVTQPVRADDPALKSLMKAFALAALSTDADIGLSMSEQAIAVERAGEKLFSATDGVVALQATLGRGEARVEDSIARHAARQTSFGILRNEMVAADPFETASALQEAETMLERHYLVTARLAGLSLAGYLR